MKKNLEILTYMKFLSYNKNKMQIDILMHCLFVFITSSLD